MWQKLACRASIALATMLVLALIFDLGGQHRFLASRPRTAGPKASSTPCATPTTVHDLPICDHPGSGAEAAAQEVSSADVVNLRARTFVPDSTTAVPSTDGPGLARRHFIVQYEPGSSDEVRRELEKRGVHCLQYVPSNAVSVSAPPDADLSGIPGIRATFGLLPEDRVSPYLRKTILPDLAAQAETPVFVEFHPDVKREEAIAILASAGIKAHLNPTLPGNVVLARVSAENLLHLSKKEPVAWVFPATEDIMASPTLQYCAGMQTSQGIVANYATHGDGWDGPGRGSATLGYYFGTSTSRLPVSLQQSEMVRALNVWSRYAQIRWQQVSARNQSRCVDLHFFTGDHGDGNAFDGPGGILAHGYYPAPPNPEPIAGDIHFDGAEDWHAGANTDLFSVALHEAGHALGLEHSDNPSAVMYAYYRGVVSDLAQDDINGIRAIYASTDQTPAPTDDHGNDAAHATSIPNDGTTIAGNIERGGDVDFFSFQAVQGATHLLSTSGLGAGMDTVLTLFDANGTTVLREDDDSGGNRASLITWNAPASARYFLRVRHYNAAGTGTYRVAARVVAPPRDDHGNDPAHATLLRNDGTPTAGSIEIAGDVDFFSFAAVRGARHTLSTGNLAGGMDTVLTLFDTNGVGILAEDDDSGGNLASRITWVAPTSATYFLRVRHYSQGGVGTCQVSAMAERAPQDDHGNSPSQATPLTVNGVSVAGAIESAGDVDYFSFDAQRGFTYILATKDLGPGMDTFLTLFDVNGTTILAQDDDSGGGYASLIRWTAPAAGRYYLRVRHFSPSGTGTYRMAARN